MILRSPIGSAPSKSPTTTSKKAPNGGRTKGVRRGSNNNRQILSFEAERPKKRPAGSLPRSKPPPARHLPGARSARWERCLSILSQTTGENHVDDEEVSSGCR